MADSESDTVESVSDIEEVELDRGCKSAAPGAYWRTDGQHSRERPPSVDNLSWGEVPQPLPRTKVVKIEQQVGCRKSDTSCSIEENPAVKNDRRQSKTQECECAFKKKNEEVGRSRSKS